MVFACLQDKNKPADAVIALTDVYTGHKIEFQSALIAKKLMSLWVGDEPRFHPHVALHDFEAWLLPYWSRIQQLAGSKRKTPSANPEVVNHGKSPAYWLKEVFETGKNSKSRSYMKTIHVGQILDKQDLLISIEACPEFKSFINTILQLCDPATMIP